MSNTNNTANTAGYGLGGLVFLLLLALKLTGTGMVAAWSWWWVTAPLWAPAALVLAFLLVSGLGYLCFAAFLAFKMRK